MTGLRVALVSEHASPLATLGGEDAGGQNVAVAALATELGRRGHRVVVHTRRDGTHLPRRVQLAPNVVVDHVPAGPPDPVPKDELFPFMPQFAAELRRQWEHQPPDVVHSHFWMSGWASVTAARPLGLPVLHTFHALGVVKRRHQGDKDTSPEERLSVEADLVRSVDRLVATCTDEVGELRRLGADPERISVVPCGVDPALFSPNGSRAPRRHGRHRMLIVSRLVERKGVGNVISALAAVPGGELLIAGGPPARELATDPAAERLRALAAAAGVADRTRLLGRVTRTQLPALLRSADVVVCVPWYEPFGLVPLEAMACGVPVLASAVGGLTDTVVDGKTGLLIAPRDPRAVAQGLRALLADPAWRAELGAAGRRRVCSRYTWPRIVQALVQDYVAARAVPAAVTGGGVA